MAMRRELRWIYKALLKPCGRVISIKRVLGLYEQYESLRKEIGEDKDAPGSLKSALHPIEMPKYLKWISQYIIYGEEDEDKLKCD